MLVQVSIAISFGTLSDVKDTYAMRLVKALPCTGIGMLKKTAPRLRRID